MAAPKKTKAALQQSPAEMLATKQADLLGYKRGLAVGELKNPSIIRITRKEIARLKTVMAMEKASKEGDK